MNSEQTPRINSTMLENFINRTIRMVGKVLELRGETATVDSAGSALIHMASNTHWAIGHYVEVVAKVQQDLSLKVLMSLDLGTDVDMNAYEALVDANHKFKEIFYDQ
ncbi:replication factor A protein 3 [Kalaharituber pfeilii]|nr:replication factor A protein 3 [Kalaharituber pfeilii]